MKKEVWKDISGYKGYYMVSNFGRVKSLKFEKERVLKPIKSSTGHHVVSLYVDNIRKNIHVHQLMAITFLGHKPNGHELIVDHIDNDKNNNHVYNLQIITQRKNSSKDKRGYSSDHIGVSWFKRDNKWMSQIYINGKNIHLGCFEKELDAAKAYQNELKKLS